MANYNCIF
nr:unnamed protein product [Callosobruchus analis]